MLDNLPANTVVDAESQAIDSTKPSAVNPFDSENENDNDERQPDEARDNDVSDDAQREEEVVEERDTKKSRFFGKSKSTKSKKGFAPFAKKSEGTSDSKPPKAPKIDGVEKRASMKSKLGMLSFRKKKTECPTQDETPEQKSESESISPIEMVPTSDKSYHQPEDTSISEPTEVPVEEATTQEPEAPKFVMAEDHMDNFKDDTPVLSKRSMRDDMSACSKKSVASKRSMASRRSVASKKSVASKASVASRTSVASKKSTTSKKSTISKKSTSVESAKVTKEEASVYSKKSVNESASVASKKSSRSKKSQASGVEDMEDEEPTPCDVSENFKSESVEEPDVVAPETEDFNEDDDEHPTTKSVKSNEPHHNFMNGWNVPMKLPLESHPMLTDLYSRASEGLEAVMKSVNGIGNQETTNENSKPSSENEKSVEPDLYARASEGLEAVMKSVSAFGNQKSTSNESEPSFENQAKKMFESLLTNFPDSCSKMTNFDQLEDVEKKDGSKNEKKETK